MANHIDEMIIKGGFWINEEIISLFRGFTAAERVEVCKLPSEKSSDFLL
jgi:hypothetical protein